jgi:Xaa-Pro aminopeptidase
VAHIEHGARIEDGATALTTDDYVRRMGRAVESAGVAGFDGLVVAPGPDMAYLCGYAPPAATERLTALILTRRLPPTLVVPTLEQGDALHATGAPALSIVDWRDGASPYELAATLLDAAGHYAVSDNTWAMHLLGLQRALPDTRYTSLTDGLPMLRAVKEAQEVQRLAAAGAAADAAFMDILQVRFAGRTETEVAADLARLLRHYGHSHVDFTVVGSGPNGADPHHEAGSRTIQRGDAVVLDFGGLLDGYGSDTTRTVSVGEPSPQLRTVYETVRAAQQAAYEAVRPGVPCEEIDRTARRLIADAGYGDYFVHRVGHGIGVTTHEPPYLVEGEKRPLVPGMCFSIEPGIYLPGQFGVRIEDIVTVTAEGGRRLNNSTRDLQVVE